jgi:hypothetical protein
VVVASTINDNIPEFNGDYSDDGLHFNNTGGPIASANVVASIENGTIDLRDAWD